MDSTKSIVGQNKFQKKKKGTPKTNGLILFAKITIGLAVIQTEKINNKITIRFAFMLHNPLLKLFYSCINSINGNRFQICRMFLFLVFLFVKDLLPLPG